MGKAKEKLIAIVGVSSDPDKFGYRIFSDLLKNGYGVYGINVRGGRLHGQEIYKSLRELPSKPDLVVTVVPPAVTSFTVDECAALGIGEIWMQPGSESEEAVLKAEKNGIKATSGACIMVAEGIW